MPSGMIISGRLPLYPNRFTPYADTWTFRGVDLTDAVMHAQVKATKDNGVALVDLNTVTLEDTEGLRLVSAGLVDGIMTSEVAVYINEATIEPLPRAGIDAEGEVGSNVELYWDLHVTPTDGTKQVYLYGPFTVVAGVTETTAS